MAEIRVEEEKGSLAWLWILLAALLIGLAVWWYMNNDNTTADPAVVPPATVDSVLNELEPRPVPAALWYVSV